MGLETGRACGGQLDFGSDFGTANMANPLDQWRKRASFDVRALKNFIYTEEIVEYTEEIWKTLATDPVFAIPQKDLTLNEERELSFMRSKRLMEYQFLTDEMTFQNPRKKNAFVSALLVVDVGAIISLQLSAEVRTVCSSVHVRCVFICLHMCTCMCIYLCWYECLCV